MKNKNIYKYLLVALFAIYISSCSDSLLDVDPKNEYFSDNYFLSEAQVFDALVGAYDPLAWSMAYGQWISPVMMGEIRSDNANAGGDPGGEDQLGWQQLDDFTEDEYNLVIQPYYKRCYIGIARANSVLYNTKISSAKIDQYQADAKFLRAYYHFELFKAFGPIPVVDRILTPADNDLSRSSMNDIFNLITTDLSEAIEKLPAILAEEDLGRVSKGAAYALMGKAYLYWADLSGDDPALFDEAAKYFEEVILLADNGIYALEDDYRALFELGAKNTKESIFEIQHNNLYPSNWWPDPNRLIDGNGMVQLCGIRGLCGNHPTYEPGWGFMMVSESLYNTYRPDDTYRRKASVASEVDLLEDITNAGLSCTQVIDSSQINKEDYKGYWMVKYGNYKGYDAPAGDVNLTKDANTHVIRLADVYLMYAEAKIRGTQRDETTAKNYIDLVRERAMGPGDNTGNFQTADDLINSGMTIEEVIQYERRIELAMEGDRWFDLVRTGNADASLFAEDPNKVSKFNTNSIWLPISAEELSVAKNLTKYPESNLFN